MKCSNCGAQLPDDAKFCEQCGTAQHPAEDSAWQTAEAASQPSAGEQAPAGDAPAQEEPAVSEEPAAPEASAAVAVEEPARENQESWKAPVQEEPSVAVTPQKSKKGLIAAVAAAAVLVVAIICFVIGGRGGSDPKSILTSALENTSEVMLQEQEESKKLLDWSLFAPVSDEGSHYAMSAHLQQLPEDVDPTGILTGAGLEIDMWDHSADKNLDLNMKAVLGSISLGDLNIRAQGEALAFNIPQMVGDTYYGFDVSTLEQDYPGSYIAETLGVPLSDDFTNLTLFSTGANVAEAWESIISRNAVEQIEEIARQAEEGLEVVAGEAPQTVFVNVADITCDTYTMTIPQAQMAQLMNDVMGVIFDDPTFQNYWASYRSGYDLTAGEAGIAAMDQMENLLKNAGDMIAGDCVVTFYVADNIVYGADYAIPMTVEGTAVDASAAYRLGGGENLIDNMSFTLSETIDGQTLNVSFVTEGSHIPADGQYRSAFTMDFGFDGADASAANLMTISGEVNCDLNAAEDNMDGALVLDVMGEQVRFDFTGSLAADASAQTASIQNGVLTMDVLGDVVSLDFDYAVEPLGDYSFSALEYENIFHMTEEDFTNVMNQAMTSYMTHLMSTGILSF